MRRLAFFALRTSALIVASAALGGCAGYASYSVEVLDRDDRKPIEGAVVELAQGTLHEGRATTDSQGEGVVVARDTARLDLSVTFDGTTDRYFISRDRVPTWDAPFPESEGAESGVRFVVSDPHDSRPHWLVRVLRLRTVR